MACISAVMAWLSSAKRSLNRPCVVIDLVTHRAMQPVSRPERALEVKSSTHEAKQLSTRPPKSCLRLFVSRGGKEEGWIDRATGYYRTFINSLT